MSSVLEIRDRLIPVFPPAQADALAHLVVDLRDEQPTHSDFEELKGVVFDLAEAQKRTESRVEELAEAQKRTESRVEELAVAQKRTENSLQQLARQVGGLSEAFGGTLEDFACDLVPELLEKYWNLIPSFCEPDGMETGEGEYPFDLVVRGTIHGKPVTVLIEVKSNVTATEATKFLRLVEKVRTHQPQEDIRAVFFGFRADKAARKAITEAGAAMVFTRGVIFPN
jgi:predicted transcriptional regulator